MLKMQISHTNIAKKSLQHLVKIIFFNKSLLVIVRNIGKGCKDAEELDKRFRKQTLALLLLEPFQHTN